MQGQILDAKRKVKENRFYGRYYSIFPISLVMSIGDL